jgi:hypothetical protein
MASGIFAEDNWSFSNGTVGGDPVIVRARSGLPSTGDMDLFCVLVTITWKFGGEEKGLLPDTTTLDSMEKFENAVLESADEDRWWGSGVAVITRQGRREWRFYTPDVEQFLQELSRVLADHDIYPLEIDQFMDPDWTGLKELQ